MPKQADFEQIFSKRENILLAVILRRPNGQEVGISFPTEPSDELQVGHMHWKSGHVIVAHEHNPIVRKISTTQEVLFIRSGIVRVDLYVDSSHFECSRTLTEGDVIYLRAGGHGFEILEDADIVEVKQGPYKGEGEKTRFRPSDNPHWNA